MRQFPPLSPRTLAEATGDYEAAGLSATTIGEQLAYEDELVSIRARLRRRAKLRRRLRLIAEALFFLVVVPVGLWLALVALPK